MCQTRPWKLRWSQVVGLITGVHGKHADVIKWEYFPCYWPFVRGIHRSTVNSPQKGQWRSALMFSLICAWTNDWINNWDADDLRRYRAHFDVTVKSTWSAWEVAGSRNITCPKAKKSFENMPNTTTERDRLISLEQLRPYILRPRQNDRQVPDDIFKYIFLYECMNFA